MEQLSLGMARGMRQPGEGAVSDFEGKIFAKMAGGYNRPYGTNVAFAQAGKSLAQRQFEMPQSREAYPQANETLVGTDTVWSKYGDANHIHTKAGTPPTSQPRY